MDRVTGLRSSIFAAVLLMVGGVLNNHLRVRCGGHP